LSICCTTLLKSQDCVAIIVGQIQNCIAVVTTTICRIRIVYQVDNRITVIRNVLSICCAALLQRQDCITVVVGQIQNGVAVNSATNQVCTVVVNQVYNRVAIICNVLSIGTAALLKSQDRITVIFK
jgi:hypothetical protein